MPKFDETTTTGGFFRVDIEDGTGLNPYQKGDYIYNFNATDETLAIVPKDNAIKTNSDGVLNVVATVFSSWTDSSGTPYDSYTALKAAVEGASFLG